MKTVFKYITIVMMLSLIATCVLSQNLPRRVYLGIRMENLTEDAKAIMGLDTKAGILISEILPNSTAEKAGFKKGDILNSINSKEVFSTQDVFSVLATLSPGSSFTYEIIRNKKRIKSKSVIQSFPEEAYADLDVAYTAANLILVCKELSLPSRKQEKNFLSLLLSGEWDVTRWTMQWIQAVAKHNCLTFYQEQGFYVRGLKNRVWAITQNTVRHVQK